MTLQQVILINCGALLAAIGGIFLKRVSLLLREGADGLILRLFFSPDLWLGCVCYVLPIFFWSYLLKEMELTKLQPMLAVVYVYTVFLAFIFLGEQPSLARLAGISVVILGVVLVGRT